MHPTRRALLPLLLLPFPARADALDPALLMARLARVPERRGLFREERTLAALTQPLVSTGRLLYRRPDYLEKDTLWPQPERLVIDGNRMIVTDPDSNDPPRVIDLSGQPELLALTEAMRAPLAGDMSALRRSFTLDLAGSWPDWALDLSPVGAAAKLLRHIRLTGREDWIGTVRTVAANGDASLLQITPA